MINSQLIFCIKCIIKYKYASHAYKYTPDQLFVKTKQKIAHTCIKNLRPKLRYIGVEKKTRISFYMEVQDQICLVHL